ncbi:hypothetical protein EWM64_g3205 [Hericium alpestre]|uniref:Uncharacterized protein n=1 Tax=Hericium alpestre TaxID=135208 RepID=A0A4Z0A269_9AGAM|nr:hypothetical protein EWM64_g3205 [Hericium alpestre]
MPWVLGHDMSTDLFAKFAIRNKHRLPNLTVNTSQIFGQFRVFDKCYESLDFGRPKRQIGIDSKGRGPRQVYYVHQVWDDVPPILRYGEDGCPTEHQLKSLRQLHGGRREMWYPMADTLPWDCPAEARMPQPVVYEDEDPCPSHGEAYASGIEGGMRMLRIEEGAEEDEGSKAGPSANLDQSV